MTATLSDRSAHERVIRPRRGLVAINFAELWRFRELFWLLSWRTVLIRYKQTYIGVAWAILQPLLTMLVVTVTLGKWGKMDRNTYGAPYALTIFCALLPWQFFAKALTESSTSLLVSQNMITKIYFPRLIIPGSAVLSGTVDFLITCVLLIPLMMIYKVHFSIRMALLPFFFVNAFLVSLAAGFWSSALNVKYRDVKFVVPFIVLLGMFACPVFYVSSIYIPQKWWFLVNALNPLVGVIDGFRWCILGAKFEPYWPGFWAGVTFTLLLLVSGACYFRLTEKTFADII